MKNYRSNEVIDASIADRPLITFAVFAFNQKNYIKDAVEAAFSQNYHPLEIIISDDCSTDGTYETILDLVAAENKKSTPKRKITANRTASNAGLWSHIENVANMASGEYLIIAAGDDISLPHRTEVVAAIFQQKDITGLASTMNIMDQSGAITHKKIENDYSGHALWNYIDFDNQYFVSGASAAYRLSFLREAFTWVPSIRNKAFNNEDMLLSACLIAASLNILQYNADPLLNYRIQSDSLSNFKPAGGGYEKQRSLLRRERSRLESRLAFEFALLDLANKFPDFKSKVKVNYLNESIRGGTLIMLAGSDNFADRAKALLCAKSVGEITKVIARLPGQRVLALLRAFKELFGKNPY